MKSQSLYKWLLTAVALGFLSVAFGAFAAHGLKGVLTEKLLHSFEVDVRYQFYHVFAIILYTLYAKVFSDNSKYHLSLWFFSAGILLFSGSLYAYALTQIKFLVFITPIGGLSFLLGWGLWFRNVLLRG